MLAKLHTLSLLGIDALPVEVEVDVSLAALPKVLLVGLPEAAVVRVGFEALMMQRRVECGVISPSRFSSRRHRGGHFCSDGPGTGATHMSQTDSIDFGGTRIDYSIRRTNRRKTIAITVSPDKLVTVAAPKGTRRTLVAKKVQQKAEWIVRQQERLRRNGRQSTKTFVSGESINYLGRQYQLKVVLRSTAPHVPQASMSRGRLVVPVARRWGAKRRRVAVRAALAAWFREHAVVQIQTAVDRFSTRLGVTVASVEVREMKTRWGSGGTDGRLRFNWRIVMARKRQLEYVVAHELCHVRYHDHSREFWRLLSRVMPDYEQRRQELERMGPTLTI